MRSKTLLLLALALHLSYVALALPVIHVISSVGPPVIIRYRGDLSQKWLSQPIELKRDKDFLIKVEANEVYYLSAHKDWVFSDVLGYDPGRDGGHSDVYWRADDWGLSISYDNVHFNRVEKWRLE